MSKEQVKEPFNEIFKSSLGKNSVQTSRFLQLAFLLTFRYITLILLYYVLNRLKLGQVSPILHMYVIRNQTNVKADNEF